MINRKLNMRVGINWAIPLKGLHCTICSHGELSKLSWPPLEKPTSGTWFMLVGCTDIVVEQSKTKVLNLGSAIAFGVAGLRGWSRERFDWETGKSDAGGYGNTWSSQVGGYL